MLPLLLAAGGADRIPVDVAGGVVLAVSLLATVGWLLYLYR